MADGILTVAELKGADIAPVTKQVLGTARKMADEKGLNVAVVAIGKDIGGVADSLIKLGADTVYICDSPELENFIDESFAKKFYFRSHR